MKWILKNEVFCFVTVKLTRMVEFFLVWMLPSHWSSSAVSVQPLESRPSSAPSASCPMTGHHRLAASAVIPQVRWLLIKKSRSLSTMHPHNAVSPALHPTSPRLPLAAITLSHGELCLDHPKHCISSGL